MDTRGVAWQMVSKLDVTMVIVCTCAHVCAGLPKGGGGQKGQFAPGPQCEGVLKFQNILLFTIHITKHLQTAPSLGNLLRSLVVKETWCRPVKTLIGQVAFLQFLEGIYAKRL